MGDAKHGRSEAGGEDRSRGGSGRSGSACLRTDVERAGGGRLAHVSGERGRNRLFGAGRDHDGQRRGFGAGLEPLAGLVAPVRRRRRCPDSTGPFPGDADRCCWFDVPANGRLGGGARSGHRKPALGLYSRGYRDSALAPRRRVLGRRRYGGSGLAHPVHRRRSTDRAGRHHRRPGHGVRQPWHGRHRRALQLGAPGVGGHRGRRREHAARCAGRHWQRARLQRGHGREAVGVQLGAAAWRGRPRHLGGRQLARPAGRERLALLLHRRRGAGTRVPAVGFADPLRLRRRPGGLQPVRQLGRRGRYPHRRVPLALPDHPPRSLGPRSAGAAGALRHRARQRVGRRARRDDEVRLSLHPGPGYGRTGGRGRGAGDAGEPGARRADSPDAAEFRAHRPWAGSATGRKTW